MQNNYMNFFVRSSNHNELNASKCMLSMPSNITKPIKKFYLLILPCFLYQFDGGALDESVLAQELIEAMHHPTQKNLVMYFIKKWKERYISSTILRGFKIFYFLGTPSFCHLFT